MTEIFVIGAIVGVGTVALCVAAGSRRNDG